MAMQNKVRNIEFFISFQEKIFYTMALHLYTHYRCRNVNNRIVISFSSRPLCETAVMGSNAQIYVWEICQVGIETNSQMCTNPEKQRSQFHVWEICQTVFKVLLFNCWLLRSSKENFVCHKKYPSGAFFFFFLFHFCSFFLSFSAIFLEFLSVLFFLFFSL